MCRFRNLMPAAAFATAFHVDSSTNGTNYSTPSKPSPPSASEAKSSTSCRARPPRGICESSPMHPMGPASVAARWGLPRWSPSSRLTRGMYDPEEVPRDRALPVQAGDSSIKIGSGNARMS